MRYTTGVSAPLVRGLAGAAAATILAGCDLTAPLPTGARAFTPMPHYAAWWSMVEGCSGLSRPMREVDWYVVEGDDFTSSAGITAQGIYRRGPDQIVLASDHTGSGKVVRHEMLHALIDDRIATPSHPAEYFLDKCAGFVSCSTKCVATSEGHDVPPEGTPLVDASVLEIGVRVPDSVFSIVNYGSFGYTSIIVTARNTLERPVVVRIANVLDAPVSFAAKIDAPTASLSRRLENITYEKWTGYFRPGETRTYVFDLYMPTVRAPGVGTWSVGAAYSTQWTATPVRFHVTP